MLDKFDKHILEILQNDATLAIQEIAELNIGHAIVAPQQVSAPQAKQGDVTEVSQQGGKPIPHGQVLHTGTHQQAGASPAQQEGAQRDQDDVQTHPAPLVQLAPDALFRADGQRSAGFFF